MSERLLLEQWQPGYWRSFCPDCSWDSGKLRFHNPDAALHALALHGVLCDGPADA